MLFGSGYQESTRKNINLSTSSWSGSVTIAITAYIRPCGGLGIKTSVRHG